MDILWEKEDQVRWMASFEDARTGWDIYRSRSGDVSRPQLNEALRSRGLDPISPRTFGHYEKLRRLGYDEYVSINRLDIRHSSGSIFDLADRSRYDDSDVASPGRIVVPFGDHVVSLDGEIVVVSEGFATLRTPWTAEADRVARAKKYKRGVLVFEQVGVERAVEVVDADPSSDGLTVDVLLSFRSLLETDLVLPPSDEPLGLSRMEVNLGPSPSLFVVVHTTRNAFNMLESARGFADLALRSGDDARQPLPPPRIQRLEVSNPYEILLLGAAIVGPILAYLASRVPALIRDAAEAATAVVNTANTVQAGKYAMSAEERAAERHNIEIESLQLDRLKKQIEVADLLRELGDVPDIDRSTLSKLESLKDQAIEAAAELALGSGEISYVQTDSDSGDGDGASD